MSSFVVVSYTSLFETHNLDSPHPSICPAQHQQADCLNPTPCNTHRNPGPLGAQGNNQSGNQCNQNKHSQGNLLPILSPNNPPKIQLSCQKSIYHPSTDILRLPQVELDYRHPKYHNFSSRSFFVDKLEKSQFSNQRHYPNILYKHTKKKSLSVYYQSSLS